MYNHVRPSVVTVFNCLLTANMSYLCSNLSSLKLTPNILGLTDSNGAFLTELHRSFSCCCSRVTRARCLARSHLTPLLTERQTIKAWLPSARALKWAFARSRGQHSSQMGRVHFSLAHCPLGNEGHTKSRMGKETARIHDALSADHLVMMEHVTVKGNRALNHC